MRGARWKARRFRRPSVRTSQDRPIADLTAKRGGCLGKALHGRSQIRPLRVRHPTLRAECGPSLHPAPRSAMRTKRTCADAAIAHAAFLRNCGMFVVAVQRMSPKRSLKPEIRCKICQRTSPTCGWAHSPLGCKLRGVDGVKTLSSMRCRPSKQSSHQHAKRFGSVLSNGETPPKVTAYSSKNFRNIGTCNLRRALVDQCSGLTKTQSDYSDLSHGPFAARVRADCFTYRHKALSAATYAVTHEALYALDMPNGMGFVS